MQYYHIVLSFQLLIEEINHTPSSGFPGKFTLHPAEGGVERRSLQFSAEAAVMSWLAWRASPQLSSVPPHSSLRRALV